MLNKLKACFAWKMNKSLSDINEYYENKITGDRKVLRPTSGTMQPIKYSWLEEAKGRAWCYDKWGDRKYLTKDNSQYSFSELAESHTYTSEAIARSIRVQRDMNVIRAITNKVEAKEDLAPRTITLEGYDELIVDRHVAMLFDEGLLEGRERKAGGMPCKKIFVTDLTMDGHQLAAQLRDEDTWSKIINVVSPEKLACVSLTELREIAGELASQWLRKKLGLTE